MLHYVANVPVLFQSVTMGHGRYVRHGCDNANGCDMTGTEIIVIAAATVAGPILAVQAQKWVERATERRRARRSIFHALMSNRATRLHDDFLKALNLIDLEFSGGGSKDRAVINAWRSLFGEYHQPPVDQAPEAEVLAWNQRINDHLVSLLLAMSKALGYDFSEEQLRRGIYYPKGRVELEQSQLAVLHGVQKLLEGRSALPMKITEAPSSPELIEAQIAMMKKSANAYSEDGALKVKMVEREPDKARPGE
jgi:hypothetical protein